MNKTFFSKKSFSIIELMVVLSVAGIISTTSIICTRAILKNITIKKNKQKINLVQGALQNYFNIYGRLPMPARYDLYRNSEDYGKEPISIPHNWTAKTSYYTSEFVFNRDTNENKEEIYKTNIDTTIYYGIIPFKELKITEEDVIDVYGNYIEYYVPKIMTLKKYDSITDNADSTKKNIKTEYSEKSSKSGTYDSYICPAKQNQLPSSICDETDDVIYGVKFKQYKIPDDYVQLSYIESTGEQYIATGVSASASKTRMIFKMQPTQLSSSEESKRDCFYGTNNGSLTFEHLNKDSTSLTFWKIGEENYLGEHKGMEVNHDSEYDITYDNNGTMIVKGAYNSVIDYTGSLPDERYSFIFFSDGNGCSSSMRLFYLKIYQNDELIRNYIPCYNKNNNKIGLYDTVNGIFYTNNGSGTFKKGLEMEREKIDFIFSPYGLRVKNAKTEQSIDKNNSFAYILLSHGENGKKTCSIRKPGSFDSKPIIISELTASNATADNKYEAQNCLEIGHNQSLDIVGRNNFLSSKNMEITLYQGEENSNFDDVCVTKTLTELMSEKLRNKKTIINY